MTGATLPLETNGRSNSTANQRKRMEGMNWKIGSKRVYRMALWVALIGLVAGTALAITSPTQAHCDSEKGPVATAAHQALISDDVKLILPYVKPEAEAELTAAFKEARIVRKPGGAIRDLADRYFIETAVRLHRAGEGAPYTGVTDEATPASILTADKAMASGSMTEVNKMLEQAMRKGIEARYHSVVEAREAAKRLNTVEAHRERVEAELMFEKYVYELYTAAANTEALTEGHGH